MYKIGRRRVLRDGLEFWAPARGAQLKFACGSLCQGGVFDFVPLGTPLTGIKTPRVEFPQNGD